MDNQRREDVWSVLIQWEGAFEILSLERSEPFFPAMGLHISNTAVIRMIAHRYIEKLESLSEATLEARTAVMEESLREVADVTDKSTAEHLSYWIRVIVSLGNPSHHFGWPWLLRQLAGVRGRDISLVKPSIQEEKLAAITRIIRDKFEDELDVRRLIDEADMLPKSNWDKKIYAKGDVGYSPLMTVSTTITENRFRETWAEIENLLSHEEINELVRWAKGQAPEFNLRPELLERPHL